MVITLSGLSHQNTRSKAQGLWAIGLFAQIMDQVIPGRAEGLEVIAPLALIVDQITLEGLRVIGLFAQIIGQGILGKAEDLGVLVALIMDLSIQSKAKGSGVIVPLGQIVLSKAYDPGT